MEWWLVLLLIFGSLLVVLASGMPVAFGLLLLSLMGAYIYFGGQAGLVLLIFGVSSSVATFTNLPILLFVLMGEVIFHSGIAPNLIDAIDKWLGHLPGRLALVAVGAGVLLATLTGVSMASAAMLGTVLVPEMEKRGYKKEMSIGPIMASGTLAAMIPPSALAVLLGIVGDVSIGKTLIAIIIPGLLMASVFAAYIIIRCKLQPSLAPSYEVSHVPLRDKLTAAACNILPVGIIIFLVTGVIFLGIATPSEAAATGALGCFLLAAAQRTLNWQVVKKSAFGTIRVAAMILIILVGATLFGQVMAASGTTQSLVKFVVGLDLPPIVILILMMIVVFILGCPLDAVPILMITVPLFMPIVQALGYDPVWFAVIMLINLEVAPISPPFGLVLFVMKGVAPPDTTMEDIFKASIPFCICDLVSIALVMAFPAMALWLPSIMLK